MEKNNGSKRKKDKCNEEALLKAEKIPKSLKHDWQQTDSEVTITLYVGKTVHLKDVQYEFSDQTCTVKLPDGRVFCCELFEAVVPEGTDIKQKASKVIVKMVKKEPRTWNALQAVDQEVYGEDARETKPVIELHHIKNDWYEKNQQTLSLSVFIPQISKDAFAADFQEDHVILRFQTSDPKFLKLNNATGDSTFVWRVNVKEAIVPKECSFRLSDVKVEVTLKKKVAERWGAMEKLPESKAAVVVANSGWVSAIKEVTLDLAVNQSADNMDLNASKKPTCLVTPLSRDKERAKGLTGLDNLGNTCFMNSILQCLANTREFRDYFLESHFQFELNLENPLGTGGHLAVAFATLLRMLWAGTHTSLAPSKMKTLIGQKAIQFTGFAQHDAQELMAFLLDGLHEDLNRVKKKPYVETVDYDGQPDEIAADESWQQYKKRNDSVVVDLFQGQYKSRLQCPICHKVSITFDPFLYLALPMPKRQRPLSVFFFSLDSSQKPLKLVILLSHDATVDQLRQKVASRVAVKPLNLRVFEMYQHGIHKEFLRGATLGHIQPTDTIVIYEILDQSLLSEPILEFLVFQRIMIPTAGSKCSFCKRECTPEKKLKRCTKCYKDAYCDQICQKSHWQTHKASCQFQPELVGCPFLLSLPASRATYTALVRKMEMLSRYSVDVFQPPVSPPKQFGSCDSPQTNSIKKNNEEETQENKGCPDSTTVKKDSNESIHSSSGKEGERAQTLFQIRIVDETGRSQLSQDYLQDKGEEPLSLRSGSYLSMDWKNNKTEVNYALVQSKSLDFEWQDPKDVNSQLDVADATLDQCLKLFTEPEVLSPQEAWYCPRCENHREASKVLSLWRLPPVLIVQLKRFSFSNLIWRDKIDEMVHFPIRGLDLSPYIEEIGFSKEQPPIYDLYAVVNHMGNILGGHYTAYARLPDLLDTRKNTIDWRLFDDNYVTHVSECDVLSRAAYVLFYRRRNTPVNHLGSHKELKEMENAKLQDAITDSNLYDTITEDSPETLDDIID